MSGALRAGIRALTVVFPGAADGHGAVGIEFRPGFGGVGAVETRAVHGKGKAHAALHFVGGGFLGVLLGRFVERTQLVEHFGRLSTSGF